MLHGFASLPALALLALTGLFACSKGAPSKPAQHGSESRSGDAAGPGSNMTDEALGESAGATPREGAVNTYVYVGSGDWVGTTGKLQVFALDERSGALSPIQEISVGNLNSFIAFHPTRSVLYAGDETGKKLRAYSVDRETGKLSFLNEAETAGGPVYISVDKTGKYALLAYYNEGSVEVFSLDESGAVERSVERRATGEKAHSVVFDPAERFVFVPNLGSNAISQLAFDATTGKLNPVTPPSVARQGGPRLLSFAPRGDRAYVVNELASTLTAYRYSGEGQLSELETIPNTPPAHSGARSGGHVAVTPSGRYLYATNRAGLESTLGMYAIDDDGKLTNLGFEKTRGATPRHFAIHPSGELLLVGNQDSNNVATFRIGDDGKLENLVITPVGVKAFWVGFLVVPN